MYNITDIHILFYYNVHYESTAHTELTTTHKLTDIQLEDFNRVSNSIFFMGFSSPVSCSNNSAFCTRNEKVARLSTPMSSRNVLSSSGFLATFNCCTISQAACTDWVFSSATTMGACELTWIGSRDTDPSPLFIFLLSTAVASSAALHNSSIIRIEH